MLVRGSFSVVHGVYPRRRKEKVQELKRLRENSGYESRPAAGRRTRGLLRTFISLMCVWQSGSGTSRAIIPLKPKDGLNGAPGICCRRSKNYGALVGPISGSVGSHTDSARSGAAPALIQKI